MPVLIRQPITESCSLTCNSLPAEFERDLIRERTRAGLASAAKDGRIGGRRPVITEAKLEKARKLMAKGLTVRETATALKIGKTSLYKKRSGS